MEKSRKLKFLMIITIFFFSFVNINNFFTILSTEEGNNSNNHKQINPKKSGSWILTGSPIYIDDTDPNYNWSKTANDNGWCSGTGTLNDPYLIENVTINGLDLNNNIEIRNSNKYFKIKNCTLYNSATGNDYAAIKLHNASNCILVSNNFSSNNGFGIIIRANSNNNIITENTLINNRGGILLDNCDFNLISENNISESTWSSGLYLWYSNNNTISNNNVNNNGLINLAAGGIRLDYSNDNNFTNNIANYNSDSGISLYSSHRNGIEGNVANDNWAMGPSPGIRLSNSNNNAILNNSAIDNSDVGIDLFRSMFNDIWLNNASKNKNHGIELSESHNNSLWRNIVNENKDYDDENGIRLYQSNYNNISQNKVNDNEENGILLDESHYNNVSGNILKDFFYGGIKLYLSENNTLYNNTAYSGNYGFIIDHSHNNTLLRNNATGNGGEGISVIGGSNNKILKNILNNNAIYHSPGGGMRLIAGCSFNYISENILDKNEGLLIGGYGIELSQCYNNTIIKNNMTDNFYYGIYMISYNFNNTISQNIIKESVRGISMRGSSSINDHCYDNYFTHNTLFNNSYGFYLDLYCHNNTFAVNDIINNTEYGVFMKSTCEKNLLYENNFINNTIHAFDNGLDNYWNNSVIGNYWDNYTGMDANDDGIGDIPYAYISGIVGSQDYLPIWEDTDDIAPLIMIISPSLNQKFRFNAPMFNVSIIELYLNTSWYTLDGGVINTTFSGLTGQINQSLWDALPNGTLTITFFINDSTGRIASDSIIIYKDIIGPNITIISPTLNEILGKKAPRFNISIKDSDLDDLWYMLDNGILSTINITASSLIGSIDQGLWDYFADGDLTIKFYANDTLGNMGKKFILITKDNQDPDITINSPITNDVFGAIAPLFNVTINDDYLDLMWYTLDGGINNYTFSENGSINQTAWDSLLSGIVTLRFYAMDEGGNIKYEEVIIIKDIQSPEITINSPTIGDMFSSDAPSFDIIIKDDHLAIMWYSLDGGLHNYTFTENATIDQAAWDDVYEGTVIIRFFANDTLGNFASESVQIIKDIQAPIIIINSPTTGAMFDHNPPFFNVNISDAHLDLMWYTLDGGIYNYTFSDNGTINQIAWDALPSGNVSLEFYAKDEAGNIGYNYAQIIKDIQAPIIIINSPAPGDMFSSDAPSFIVTIIDDHLETMWYSLDGGLHNYTFTENGTIDQAAWDDLPEGTVIIRFHANDTLGQSASELISIHKSIPDPGEANFFIIITISLISAGAVVSIILIIILRKRKELKGAI